MAPSVWKRDGIESIHISINLDPSTTPCIPHPSSVVAILPFNDGVETGLGAFHNEIRQLDREEPRETLIQPVS